ncbi:MAG: hypothetical protein ACK5KP_01550 [Paludibacteraceae bacterium]
MKNKIFLLLFVCIVTTIAGYGQKKTPTVRHLDSNLLTDSTKRKHFQEKLKAYKDGFQLPDFEQSRIDTMYSKNYRLPTEWWKQYNDYYTQPLDTTLLNRHKCLKPLNRMSDLQFAHRDILRSVPYVLRAKPDRMPIYVPNSSHYIPTLKPESKDNIPTKKMDEDGIEPSR